MEKLRDYIAFDLEFNKHEGVTHLIQVSAVRFQDGQECATFDSYVHTTAPLKSFINGLTGITAETLKDAPKVEQVLKDFQAFVGDLPMLVTMQLRVICLFSWSMALIIVTSIRSTYMMRLLNAVVLTYTV